MDFRSASAVAEGALAAVSLTVVKPAGAAEDDMLIACMLGNILAPAWVAPGGWAAVDDQDFGGAVTSDLAMFWKRAGGAEGADYAFTCGANDRPLGVILAYRNVFKAAGEVLADWVMKKSKASGASAGAFNFPTVACELAPYLLLAFAVDANVAATHPTGWTERVNGLSSGAPIRRLFVLEKVWLESTHATPVQAEAISPAAVHASILCGIKRIGEPLPYGLRG